MKRLRLPAIWAAALLQILPIARQVCTAPAFNSTFAIIFRWAAGTAIALESVDAVSGATTVYFTMPSTNFIGTVGVPVDFLLTMTNYGSDSGAYFTNANGFPLPAGLSITTYDHPPDVHGNIIGTPTLAVTNLKVKITANWKDGSTLLTASTNINITIQSSSGVAPVITNQPPASQTILAGGTTDLGVGASGTAPLSFQWRREGLDLAGSTGSALTLTGVRTNQAGTYTVVVGNSISSVTSAPSVLNVTVPAAPQVYPGSPCPGLFALTFNPVAGLTNSVQTNSDAAGVGWVTLTNIPPPANTNAITITDAISGAQRYYRVLFAP